MKWYEKFMTISAVQCNYNEDSFEILEKHTAGKDFNTEQLFHLTAEDHTSFYEEEKHGDKLDKYIKRAKKLGIRIIMYLNVHCIEEYTKQMHPEWLQLEQDGGNAGGLYGDKYRMCPNIDGEWFKYYSYNLNKLMKHGIDGIFLDGPGLCQEACRCVTCQETFKKEYGYGFEKASFNNILEHKINLITAFVKETNRIIKENNPNVILYLNNSALRSDITGTSTSKVLPYVDMIGAEGGFIYNVKTSFLWKCSVYAKYLESKCDGKPCVIFSAGDNKPWSYYMHTAQETEILYAQSAANGSNVWYGIHGPTPMMDSPGGDKAHEMNTFFKENGKYFEKTNSCSKVALMWSQDSANYYSASVALTDFTENMECDAKGGKKADHYKAFMGYVELFLREHIQFDIVDEEEINKDKLDKYDTLVLPCCACMTSEVSGKIKEFTKEGGFVLATYDTGFYNKDGMATYELNEMFGMEKVEDFIEYGLSGLGYTKLDEAWEYTSVSQAKLIPSFQLAVKATYKETSVIYGGTTKKMGGRYVALPEETFPAIVETQYGKGKCLYFSGCLGQFYEGTTNPDIQNLVKSIISNNSEEVLVTNAPDTVEVVLRHSHKEKAYLVHLINLTGEMTRPIKRLLPVYDIEIDINNIDVSKISVIKGEEKIQYNIEDNTVKLKIPILHEYSVIVLEK